MKVGLLSLLLFVLAFNLVSYVPNAAAENSKAECDTCEEKDYSDDLTLEEAPFDGYPSGSNDSFIAAGELFVNRYIDGMAELGTRASRFQCGSNCQKHERVRALPYIHTFGPDGSDSTCGGPVIKKTLTITGRGLTCDLAKVSLMLSLAKAMSSADKICQEARGSNRCSAKQMSISETITTDSEPTLQISDYAIGCTMKAELDIAVACGAGERTGGGVFGAYLAYDAACLDSDNTLMCENNENPSMVGLQSFTF